jgi:hypothetical protein
MVEDHRGMEYFVDIKHDSIFFLSLTTPISDTVFPKKGFFFQFFIGYVVG